MNRLSLPVLGLLCLCLSLQGCAGIIDAYFVKAPEDTAQELYDAAANSMQEKEYAKAVAYYKKIIERYPFSPYTPVAELGLGDALFADGRYKEAIDAYKEFESLHPRHEKIPYVLFQIGLAGYKDFDSIDKPQDRVSEAIQYLTRVRESYPDSPYAAQADGYIAKCRRYVAEHELYVADFYWNASRYLAAWQRYEYVRANFQDIPDVVAYASRRSEHAYYNYQRGKSEEERARVEGSWKDWFSWL